VSEFDEKLNTLLSNPESMAQIMQLAQTLSGQAGGSSDPSAAPQEPQKSASDGQSSSPPPPPRPQTPPPDSPSGNSADILSALSGGLDPKLLSKLLPVLQELNSGNDNNARKLLFALRPYLKPERQERVERALQLARLIHIGKKFLAGWEG